jgi:ankyrin repeat protein
VIVRALMAHGTSHHNAHFDDHPLLAEAAGQGHVEVVKLLIACGANPHELGKDGKTALAWAAEQGHHEVVHFLEQARASH